MIIVRLWGGLGNQMFQYSLGYSIAKKKNSNLLLDTRFYTDDYIKKNPHFTKQKPNILEFPIEYKKETNLGGEYKLISFLQNRTISRIIRIPGRFCIKADNGIKYVKETRLDVDRVVLENPYDDAYYDGYWQSEQYFEGFKDEIKRQLIITNKAIEDEVITNYIDKTNAVSVHMRLGDYGKKRRKLANYNYVISPEYYIKAMDEIKTEVGDVKFFIFSNNIELARRLLDDKYDYVVVNEDRHITDIEEFMVMSRCKHHIISNSTFSWWAAWLNDSGITIAPDMVFGNKKILPERWIKCQI